MKNYIIKTPCGEIRGTDCRLEGVVAYKGIRYATAGRWEYPKQVTAWDGVYDATKYGNCSYQPRTFYDEEYNEKKYFYYKEFRKGETYTYSEYSTTCSGTGTDVENIEVKGKSVKMIVNGQLIIIKNGVTYNAQGQVVK